MTPCAVQHGATRHTRHALWFPRHTRHALWEVPPRRCRRDQSRACARSCRCGRLGGSAPGARHGGWIPLVDPPIIRARCISHNTIVVWLFMFVHSWSYILNISGGVHGYVNTRKHTETSGNTGNTREHLGTPRNSRKQQCD